MSEIIYKAIENKTGQKIWLKSLIPSARSPSVMELDDGDSAVFVTNDEIETIIITLEAPGD